MGMERLAVGYGTKAFFLVLSAAVGVTVLSACATRHQVISSASACPTCHGAEKETYDVALPATAQTSSGEVSITMRGADTVEVCRVVFASEDGATCVPVAYSSKRVTDGEATTITLDAGTWALVAPDSYELALIVVDADANVETPQITLQD
jgi:hypothetical protein